MKKNLILLFTVLSNVLCVSMTNAGTQAPVVASKNPCMQELHKRIDATAGLHLEKCALNDNDVTELVASLPLFRCDSTSPCVSTLYLSKNHIGSRGAFALSFAKVSTIDISENPIGVEGVKYLANNIYLTTLYLNNLNLGDQLAYALKWNINLRVLSAKANDLSAEGARTLAKMPKLQQLFISHNRIGDAGAIALANYKSNLLDTLDVSYNHIGEAGIKALLNANISNLNYEGNEWPK